MDEFIDSINPREASRRSIRRAFGDGVEEIYIGLFMMLMSALYLVYVSTPRGSQTREALGFISTVMPYSVVMMLIALRKRVKAAYVFPRTGYVAFRTCAWQKRMLAGVGLFTLAFGLAAVFWKPLLMDMASISGLLTSAVLALALLWGGLSYRFPHLSSLAGLSILVGSLTFTFRTGGSGPLWVMLVMGSALAVAGALRFGIFVKTHPLAMTHPGIEAGE